MTGAWFMGIPIRGEWPEDVERPMFSYRGMGTLYWVMIREDVAATADEAARIALDGLDEETRAKVEPGTKIQVGRICGIEEVRL